MSLPPTFVEGFHDEDSVRKMKYKPLGNTGMIISQLALGTGPLGGLYGPVAEEEAINLVHVAIKSGINYIDTAPWYGHSKSEIVLGKALKDVPRKAYYLGTKTCRYDPEYSKMFDFTAERTRKSIETSLQRLGVDYVDVIKVHDVEFAASEDMVINETLPVLKEAVDKGQARFIAITGYPISKLASIVEKSKVHIDVILSYARCGLLDNELLKYMKQFDDLNIGIINAAPIYMGLLSDSGPPEWHPASQEIKNACKEAAKFCKSQDVSISRLAINAAIKAEGSPTLLVGCNTKEFLMDNLHVVHNGLTAKEKQVQEIVQKKYFDPLKVTHWEGFEVENYWKNINAGK